MLTLLSRLSKRFLASGASLSVSNGIEGSDRAPIFKAPDWDFLGRLFRVERASAGARDNILRVICIH
jgi:hypothetical protein